jgi:hypothetical protein
VYLRPAGVRQIRSPVPAAQGATRRPVYTDR